MENAGDAWHRALAKRIGEAVAARRKELGMTAQQLATRCSEFGAPIHRTTITKIENGRPRFDLGELIVLGAALDRAPIALLFPDVLVPIELLPGLEVIGTEALGWFSGLGTDSPVYGKFDDNSEPALEWAWRSGIPAESWSFRLVGIEEAIKEQVRQLAIVESVPDSPAMSEKQKAIREENVNHARRVMKLLKDDWHDTVYGQLIRKYGGPQNIPDDAYPRDRLALLENELREIYDADA